MRLALFLVPAVFMAGCLGTLLDGFEGQECPPTTQTVNPFPILGDSPTDPEQAWDMLYLVGNSSLPTTYDLSRPDDWTHHLESFFGQSENDTHLLRVRAEPGNRDPKGGLMTLSWRETGADPLCWGFWDFLSTGVSHPEAGDHVHVGHGAMVMTAGFLPNGTLFYTNMDEMNSLSEWPATSWYTWEGGDPLPVYVYDQDRSERPPEWNATAPVPPGSETSLWSYFTTIRGFNEALKGLSVNTARVVYINATDAYTQPGREDHPLFGHDLVFYIRVLETVDEPWCAELPFNGPCVARP